MNLVHRRVMRLPGKDVFGHVHQHRAGTSRCGNVERFVDHLRQVGNVLHQEIVLGGRTRNAECVCFLKGIRAHQLRRNLSVSATIGIESIIASTNPVTRLVAPGPEVAPANADFPGCARISLCREGCVLLMPDQHVLDGMVIHRVIKRQRDAARIAENALPLFRKKDSPTRSLRRIPDSKT